LPLRLAGESAITPNTNSRIKTQSDGEILRVGVLAGEVLFDMHPDVRRQLIVSVGDLQIVDTTAIFAVELLDSGEIAVTVAKGRVQLAADGSTKTQLRYNQQATVEYQAHLLSIHIRNLRPEEVQRQLAWRLGRLEFDSDKVSDAARQVNRYNLTQIQVEGVAGDARIGGTFSPTEPLTFAQTMVAMIPNTRCESRQRAGEPAVLRIYRVSRVAHGGAVPDGCPPESGGGDE
jgi:transmembrane sensor